MCLQICQMVYSYGRCEPFNVEFLARIPKYLIHGGVDGLPNFQDWIWFLFFDFTHHFRENNIVGNAVPVEGIEQLPPLIVLPLWILMLLMVVLVMAV